MKSSDRDQIQCPCCKECKDCGGFQKVVNLPNAGLVIYRHSTQTERVSRDTGIVDIDKKFTEDVFILHNTRDIELTSADYLPEFEQNTVDCPRCRRIIEHAQKLLQKAPTINRNDVQGVCEHCRTRKAPCFDCKEMVKKFVALKSLRIEITKQRVTQWLAKMKHIMRDAVLYADTGNETLRAHSELYLNQLCRESPKLIRKPDVRQMFYPEKDHLDFAKAFPPSIDKRNKMFAHPPELGKFERPSKKGTNLTVADKAYDSATDSEKCMIPLSSEKNKKEKHVELIENVPLVPFPSEEGITSGESDAELKLRSKLPESFFISTEEIKMQRSIKTGKARDARPETRPADFASISQHVVKKKKPELDSRAELEKTFSFGSLKIAKVSHKKTSGSPFIRKYHSDESLMGDEGMVDGTIGKDFSYVFPKVSSPDLKKLKRKISSSELIKDTQDLLLARAEKDKKIQEEKRTKKLKQEEKSKIDREQRIKQLEEIKLLEAEFERKRDKQKGGIRIKSSMEKSKAEKKEKIDKVTPTASTATFKASNKESSSALKRRSSKTIESKDLKGLKESRRAKEPINSKRSREPIELQGHKGLKEPNKLKEPKASGVHKESEQVKVPKESKVFEEPKGPRAPKEPKEPKASKETKALQEPRTPKEPKEPKDAKALIEPKEPKGLKDTTKEHKESDAYKASKELKEQGGPKTQKELREHKANIESTEPKEPKTFKEPMEKEPKVTMGPIMPKDSIETKAGKEFKEPKALQESKESKEEKPPRDLPETKRHRESKDAKLQQKEPIAPKKLIETYESKESKDLKEPKSSKLKEPKPHTDPKIPDEKKESTAPKIPKEPKTTKELKELTEPKGSEFKSGTKEKIEPKELKGSLETKEPKEIIDPNKSNVPTDKKVDKNAIKTKKDDKKETESALGKEKNEKERLKNEKEQQLIHEHKIKQIEQDLNKKHKDELLREQKGDLVKIPIKEGTIKDKGEKLSNFEKDYTFTTKEEERLKAKLAKEENANQGYKGTNAGKFGVHSENTEIKDLNIKSIRFHAMSFDDLILRLVRIKQSERTRGDRILARKHQYAMGIKNKKKYQGRRRRRRTTAPSVYIEQNSDLELDAAEALYLKKRKVDKLSIIIGQNILKFKPPLKKKQKVDTNKKVPLIYQSTFETIKEEEFPKISPKVENIAPVIMTEKQVLGMFFDPEASKGVIRYALSDRSFIDKGWTMLPTEKVVRKMNVYRMRPAKPEFDWFEHNKNKRLMTYDSGERLAEFDENGRGRWFYKNGRMALDYYDAEELNANQRFVIYSNGEPDEHGRPRPYMPLATFDYLGNGVVYDHSGKVRLKYNQTEGVVLDRNIGPESHWKWHTLNDPPVLQQVMIDTQMSHKDPAIIKLGGPNDLQIRPENEDMVAIEFDNFIKEKSKKLRQSFKPFQIKMKALKINENFSLKVLDQATVYLIFRDGTTNLKLNIGMVLDHKEIVDTDTAEVGEVLNNMERLPARTDSLAGLQRNIAYAQRLDRTRTERERRLRAAAPSASADKLTSAVSQPIRIPLRTRPSASSTTIGSSKCFCK